MYSHFFGSFANGLEKSVLAKKMLVRIDSAEYRLNEYYIFF